MATGSFEANRSNSLYKYSSGLESYRLQNQNVDSHGLIRLMKWDKSLHAGVGHVPPRTLGQRISVMRCKDIFRLKDIFENATDEHTQWNITEPISDDLFSLNEGKKSFFHRPVIVRENAVYGNYFNHIFFQRYGYHIEGYGSIHPDTPLQTSEFTHHDFFINCSSLEEVKYLSSALGLIAEEEPKIDSAEQKGPKAVFQMKEGEGHWYQGFVSPNNICGKLKMFIPIENTLDKSDKQVMGALGITLHTFTTENITLVHSLVHEHGLSPTSIEKNEFGEQSFTFAGPGNCHWQIIKKSEFVNVPTKKLEFELTKN